MIIATVENIKRIKINSRITQPEVSATIAVPIKPKVRSISMVRDIIARARRWLAVGVWILAGPDSFSPWMLEKGMPS
jgi:hypothetical protein